MSIALKYWIFIRIDPDRGRKTSEIAEARTFFLHRFPREVLRESEIQGQLIDGFMEEQLLEDRDSPTSTELCLRCFISNAIEQTCIQLELKFGLAHGFTRFHLFPFVLNDVDLRRSLKPLVFETPSEDVYVPTAADILRTFNPARSNLGTWTNRLVKQERLLCAFLIEQGVYLISDWAILNDTRPQQLQRILGDFHQLSAAQIQHDKHLLASYHAVYRRDRLQGNGGRCALPTPEQLQRIGELFSLKTQQYLSPPTLLEQLQTLADLLRQYRLNRRSKAIPTQSLDDPNLNVQATFQESDRGTQMQQEFLTLYRQRLNDCLDRAIEIAVGDRIVRLQSRKSKRSQQFIQALHLLHCRGQSMEEIAPQIGLKAQYQVSRLLTLRQIRAAVKQHLLKFLLDSLLESARDYATPECLPALDRQLEVVLNEEIDEILAEAQLEAEVKNKDSPFQSLFARRLCHYLRKKLRSER